MWPGASKGGSKFEIQHFGTGELNYSWGEALLNLATNYFTGILVVLFFRIKQILYNIFSYVLIILGNDYVETNQMKALRRKYNVGWIHMISVTFCFCVLDARETRLYIVNPQKYFLWTGTRKIRFPLCTLTVKKYRYEKGF